MPRSAAILRWRRTSGRVNRAASREGERDGVLLRARREDEGERTGGGQEPSQVHPGGRPTEKRYVGLVSPERKHFRKFGVFFNEQLGEEREASVEKKRRSRRRHLLPGPAGGSSALGFLVAKFSSSENSLEQNEARGVLA